MAERDTGLVADVGGTNARLGIAEGPEVSVRAVRIFRCADFESFEALARHYFTETGEPIPGRAVVAAAGPVADNRARLTNGPWGVDGAHLAAAFGIARVEIANDFTALAWSLPWLGPADVAAIGPERPVAAAGDRVRLVVGPGTGLGVAMLVERGPLRLALATEGGHMSFAATDDTEIAILDWFRRRYGRVSVERLLSGAGLGELHAALSEIAGRPADGAGAAEVTAAALADPASAAGETVMRFLAVLGGFAGDLALVSGAGSVYIGGGIVPRVAALLPGSPLRQRFEAKGRFRERLAGIGTSLIVAATPALTGAAARLFDPTLGERGLA